VIQEQLDRLEEDGRIRLTVSRDVLVPLVLNTVLARPVLRGDAGRRELPQGLVGLPPAGRDSGGAGLMAAVSVVTHELDRIESLWEEGLSDAYRSYLDAVSGFDSADQPRLALAAALIEVGVRLQGLGGRAAPLRRC